MQAGVQGRWASIRLQPFLSADDAITIGVAFQAANGLLHGKVLTDLSRLKCLYDDALDLPSFALLTEILDLSLGGSAQPFDALRISPNIVLSAPRYVAGNSVQEIVQRLYATTVRMATAKADVTAAQLRASSEPFGALPTDAQYRVIRQQINAAKGQASMRAERVTDPMERHNLGLLITALDRALVISLDAESDARAAAGES